MSKPLTIRECLQAWQAHSPETVACSAEELLDLVDGRLDASAREDLLGRLYRNPGDRKRLWEMMRFLRRPRAEFHVALLKAAADNIAPESLSIFTEGKRYRLIYRRLLDREDEGVITISVNPTLRHAVEDHYLSVVDAGGREILRGRLEKGELSRRIGNATQIQWQTLLIREKVDQPPELYGEDSFP
jgi:hypothetical protein